MVSGGTLRWIAGAALASCRLRVGVPSASPPTYAAASTAAAISRARVLGCCPQVTGLGNETGAGIEAIALQPSEGHRRLPAVGASRTIPRHVGPLLRAPVPRAGV